MENIYCQKCSRLRDLLSGFYTLLTGRETSPAGLSHFFGVAQWALLANRPMLSCCGSIYHSVNSDDKVRKRVPTPVLRELMLMVSLLPGLVQDLQAPWTPFVSATDGAQNYGYGGVKAACSPSLTRSLASAASAGDVAFLLSGVAEGDEDIVCSVPLEMKDFKTLFSIKASGAAHASKLEMGALTILVQHLARNPRLHCSRTFCLVDSLPLLYAITNGDLGLLTFDMEADELLPC